MTSYTVTATQGGTGDANGIALTVKVVTGALARASQTGATYSDATTLTTPQHSITPSATGSWIYGSVFNGNAATAFTANGSTTFSLNTTFSADSSTFGTFRSTSTTTSGTPVTIGGSAPTETAGAFNFALLEVLASTTLAEDASAPSPLSTTTATTITSASFSPPGSSLLVAMVSSDFSASGVTMTVTSSPSLTWTQKVSETTDLASIWIADIPSGVSGPIGVIKQAYRVPLNRATLW